MAGLAYLPQPSPCPAAAPPSPVLAVLRWLRSRPLFSSAHLYDLMGGRLKGCLFLAGSDAAFDVFFGGMMALLVRTCRSRAFSESPGRQDSLR